MAIRKQRPMAIIWTVTALSSLSWNLPKDELALASKLKSLDSSWTSLDFWLNVWTLVVVIGVVVELGVIVIEYLHEKRDFEGGVVHPPDKPSVLLLTFGLLGAGLVALGVAGEFRVHVKAGKVETGIRDTTLELVALVNGKAEAANQGASANEREAKRLGKEAEDEKIARVNLQGQFIEAQRRVEDLRKANNEAAANLETEVRKRIALAISLLDRNFRDQSGAMAELSTFPRASVVFEYLDERETIKTAEQINFVLSELQWKASRKRGFEMFMMRDGITVSIGRVGMDTARVLDSFRLQKVCEAFKNALQHSGLDATVGPPVLEVPLNTIVISVGAKPNHVLEDALKELGKLPHAAMEGNRRSIPEEIAAPCKNPCNNNP